MDKHGTHAKISIAKRAAAAALTAAMLCTTIRPYANAVDPGERKNYGAYSTYVGTKDDPSWTEAVENEGILNGFYPTGLNYGCIEDNSTGAGNALWSVPQAETDVPGDFDYSAFSKIWMGCVDGHTSSTPQEVYNQAFSKGILKMNDEGDLINQKTGASQDDVLDLATNKKFSMLMLIAALGYRSDWHDVVDGEYLFNDGGKIKEYAELSVPERFGGGMARSPAAFVRNPAST